MQAVTPYVTYVSLSINTDNVVYTYKITADTYFYKIWNSYTGTWSSWTTVGAALDNSPRYNQAQHTITVSRRTDAQVFYTIHFRMFEYDWMTWTESGNSHIFRSYYISFYQPPQSSSNVLIRDEIYKYLICSGKSTYSTNNFHSSIVQGQLVDDQHNMTLIDTAAQGGNIIRQDNYKVWYTHQHSGSNAYRDRGEYDNATYSDSYPWPW